MSLDLSTTITGIAINGFTAPTYVLAADQAPAQNARQAYVATLGGTQAGVTAHAVSDPFTITAYRPKNVVLPPRPNPISGTVGNAGYNSIRTLFRKGTKPLVGQNPQISTIDIKANIIAGAEVNDLANVAALYSAASAFLAREAANYLLASRTASI